MCLIFFYASFVSVIIVAPMLWNKFLLVHNDCQSVMSGYFSL